MARKEDIIAPHELKQLFINTLRQSKQLPGLDKYMALPVQKAFHSSVAKGKLLMGGNRVGKTVGGVVEDVMRLTGIHTFKYLDDKTGEVEIIELKHLPKPPIRGRAVAVDKDRGIQQIIIPQLKMWTPTRFLIDGDFDKSYNKTHNIFTLNNGSALELMSYEQDVGKFQGTSRHFCHFDEEPPQDIFDECMARLIDTDGDWYITMTPLIEMSWTYNTLYQPAFNGTLDGVALFEGKLEENRNISMDAFERLTQTMSEEQKQTRRTGVYISHTGLVYGESFSRMKNVIPDIVKSDRFDILRNNWTHFQMMDHGYNNPTAILFACYDTDGKIIIYDEIYKNKTLIKELAQEWNERRLILGINTEYTIGDPAIASTNAVSGTSIQSEYGEAGIFIGLGNNDVHAGIASVQRMFSEQNILISSRCQNLLDELMKYRWDRHITKIRDRRNKKEEPLKKDDHACDALRYGIMSRPIAYKVLDTAPQLPYGATRTASNYDEALRERDNKIFDELLGSEV